MLGLRAPGGSGRPSAALAMSRTVPALVVALWRSAEVRLLRPAHPLTGRGNGAPWGWSKAVRGCSHRMHCYGTGTHENRCVCV